MINNHIYNYIYTHVTNNVFNLAGHVLLYITNLTAN